MAKTGPSGPFGPFATGGPRACVRPAHRVVDRSTGERLFPQAAHLEAGMTTWSPTSPLAKVVDLAGFAYDPDQDIIYSKMNAVQRNFGYAYGYDKSALLMSADIDC